MSASILVSNLASDVTESELRDLFTAIGVCHSVRIIKHHDTGVPRGFAFVQMRSGGDARKAVRLVAAHELRGRPLRIDMLLERDPTRSKTAATRRPVRRN